MRNVESEVLRLMGKGRLELMLEFGRVEEMFFDGMALGAGDGDFGESIITV